MYIAGIVVRWKCGKRASVFQGLWKAVLAFHQSVISTAAWLFLGFFFGLLGLLDSIARDVEFEDHAMMNQAIDRRRRGHRIFEDPLPFRERQVAGDEYAATFIPFGE